MRIKQNSLYLIFSGIALLLLLVIQVFWLLRAAQIKEDLFNEKAHLVLSRTSETLKADQQTCGSIGQCLENENEAELTSKLAIKDVKKIDSLLHHFMNLYHIQLSYSFKIINKNNYPDYAHNNAPGAAYSIPIEAEAIKKGIDIKLVFPEKKEFILAEMGLPFISSILLMLCIIVIFWRTNIALFKERKIAANTTEIINNMVHEFKTPLTNINLAAKMLLKEKAAKEIETSKHYANVIIDENKKLDTKIDHLLHLNAIERDEILLKKVNIDFHLIIHRALGNLQMQIEHHEMEILLQLHAKVVAINIDAEQMVNVLINIIDNAIKYAEPKSKIIITTSIQNNNLICEIRDNGIGIKKEFHTKVFEKYFRVPTNNLHQVKGFGLGLTFVKKVVEMHRGKVVLQSEPNQGTCFTLILPYV
jgi:two-component system phosphate regulon sensor histidine kinase PhoR